MAKADNPRPRVSSSLTALLQIAAELRDLPRTGFKARLSAELSSARGFSPSAAPRAVSFIPEGHHTATPCLLIRDAKRAIEFYKRAFGATELMRLEDPAGGKIWHAEIQIGDSAIAIADEAPDYNLSPAVLGGSSVVMQIYVEDVDAFAARAVAAGAKVVFPIADQFYGDRCGRLADPFGHLWIVGTHKEDVTVDEMRRRAEAFANDQSAAAKGPEPAAAAGSYRAEPYLRVRGADDMIDFLKRAFEAKVISHDTEPGGTVVHAEVMIGDSTVGIGDASDDYPPMPTALHLYVKDADAVYRRALRAGATSMHEPVDQDYGDREASVTDAWGNHWYIGTHKADVADDQPRQRAKGRVPRKTPVSYVPPGLHSVTSYLHPKGTDELIDFLKRAFNASEAMRVQPPGEVVHHAKIRIGESMVEMGEAHAPYGPMPTLFHLYVEETDAVYRRALAAGGVSLSEPANRPWGFRNAGVRDPGGNQWWINAPIARTAIQEEPMESASLESARQVMPFMYIREAADAVDFYKRVFAATELMREVQPDGLVSHAHFKIGDAQFMISIPARTTWLST